MTTQSSRADSLWRHLAQMFGADALSRKYGDSIPHDWRKMVDALSEFELGRGMRRLANSGKAHVPTLPEFLRMAREIGGDYAGDPRPDTKALASPQDGMDGWDAMAGRHLLAHILRQAKAKRYYAGSDPKSREAKELTQPLVDAKNAWADEMREAAKAGTLPTDHGRAWWNEAMQKADAAVDYIRSSRVAA